MTARTRRAFKRHCEGLGIVERIVAGSQALEVDRERPLHDISGQKFPKGEKEMIPILGS